MSACSGATTPPLPHTCSLHAIAFFICHSYAWPAWTTTNCTSAGQGAVRICIRALSLLCVYMVCICARVHAVSSVDTQLECFSDLTRSVHFEACGAQHFFRLHPRSLSSQARSAPPVRHKHLLYDDLVSKKPRVLRAGRYGKLCAYIQRAAI